MIGEQKRPKMRDMYVHASQAAIQWKSNLHVVNHVVHVNCTRYSDSQKP